MRTLLLAACGIYRDFESSINVLLVRCASAPATGEFLGVRDKPGCWSRPLRCRQLSPARLASGSSSTSTREPNLIRPTRSPRCTRSPTLRLNTIRRASNPAICLKRQRLPFAFHGHDVLLILLSRGRVHGIQELALLIAHVANRTRDRRTVHVDIEDVEKYADPRALTSVHSTSTRHRSPCHPREKPPRPGRQE